MAGVACGRYAEFPMAAGLACRICGAELHDPPFVATEGMVGTGDSFTYRECRDCGCVQIEEYPKNIGDYYPSNYYSMHVGNGSRRFERVERWLRKRRASYALGRRDPLGHGLSKLFGVLECYDWLRVAGLDFNSSILDVGCGNGFLLSLLQRDGFDRLEGVDPFASDDRRRQAGFVIHRRIEDVQQRPAFVLLSHSLEHMPEQRRVLSQVRAVIDHTTWVCIRIPLANEAWRRYREHWVQLDPPRHYYLHTPRSFAELARQTGFRIHSTRYDSTSFQFWGSEQRRMGIALTDRRSHAVALGGKGEVFSPTRMQAWEREAIELNRSEQGDQATFFLRVA